MRRSGKSLERDESTSYFRFDSNKLKPNDNETFQTSYKRKKGKNQQEDSRFQKMFQMYENERKKILIKLEALEPFIQEHESPDQRQLWNFFERYENQGDIDIDQTGRKSQKTDFSSGSNANQSSQREILATPLEVKQPIIKLDTAPKNRLSMENKLKELPKTPPLPSQKSLASKKKLQVRSENVKKQQQSIQRESTASLYKPLNEDSSHQEEQKNEIERNEQIQIQDQSRLLQRNRVRPLRYWLGEKYIYRNGRIVGAQLRSDQSKLQYQYVKFRQQQ